MAKIQTVDYMAIPGQAAQIRSEGQALNREISNAYKEITQMHSSWYGKRYNELVKAFNSMIPQLNEMLVLVVGEIPFALEKVANNYSQADQGTNAGSATNTAPLKVADIPISSDVGMRFLTENVTNVKTNVSNNFKNAKSKMNSIESIYGKITWQSEAADTFRQKFTTLKNNIVSSFESIETKFTQLMQQALTDVQSAESSNTVQ